MTIFIQGYNNNTNTNNSIPFLIYLFNHVLTEQPKGKK
jgi:hypothetical protein